jgi:hypothetical protein
MLRLFAHIQHNAPCLTAGLKATGPIAAGDFVIEYVGEVIDMKTCQERLALAKAQGISDFYMLTLDNVCVLLLTAHLRPQFIPKLFAVLFP